MWTRRHFLSHGAASAAALAAGGRLLGDGQDVLPDGSAAHGLVTPDTQKAIDRGLQYLVRNQSRDDGSFGTGLYRGNVAITSLAALALMAGGHQPGRGLYGKHVERALEFVMSKEAKNPEATPGFLHNPVGSPFV